MKVETIFHTPHFSRAFKGLTREIQQQILQKETLFRKDCFDPRLKTHKLKGNLQGFWAFSVNYSYRIVFAFEEEGSVTFIDVGPHSIYG